MPTRFFRKTSPFAWLIFLLGLFATGSTAFAQSSNAVHDAHTQAQLLTAYTTAQPGQTLRVGLRLTMDPHWHTYWTNPGTGQATRIQWTLPPGVTAGDIQWPAPIKFGQAQKIIGYGYEGEVLLPLDITVPADFAQKTLALQAKVSWLACDKTCVPGRATLALTLPVAPDQTPQASEHAALFGLADSQMPMPTDGGFAQAWSQGDALVLAVDVAGEFDTDASAAVFFPDQPGVIDDLAEQPAGKSGDRLTLTLSPAEGLEKSPEKLTGLLVVTTGQERRSFTVNTPVATQASALAGGNTPSGLSPGAGSPAGVPVQATLLPAIGYAVLGGLILNLMPCVFPILALKITGFVQQAGEQRGKIAAHGFAFAAGVIVSFWVIAIAVIALQATGRELGWGFQLQSPVFVGLMAVLLFAVALNFAGVFDLGMAVMSTAGQASTKLSAGTLVGTFGSGVLATALATPCSAPFMTTAVGFALGASPTTTVIVLTALGVGMALPYVVLSLFPAWLNLLPKPGPWMETFKQLMAFPMFAVVAYLVWVFNNQTGGGLGLPAIMAALIVAALGLWALGRWGQPTRGRAVRWASRLACVLLLGLSAAAITTAANVAPAHANQSTHGEESLPWEPYSEQALQAHLAAGRPVFVDFTADWCATCKFNERVFIDTAAVREAIEQNNVVLLRADWTRRDDDITAALSAFGVRSVPLYVFHSPDADIDPIHFSSMFSSGPVLDAIKAVSASN